MGERSKEEEQEILRQHDAAELKRISEQYGVRADTLKAYGTDLKDMERLAKLIAGEKEAAIDKLYEGAVAKVKEEGKGEVKQEPVSPQERKRLERERLKERYPSMFKEGQRVVPPELLEERRLQKEALKKKYPSMREQIEEQERKEQEELGV